MFGLSSVWVEFASIKFGFGSISGKPKYLFVYIIIELLWTNWAVPPWSSWRKTQFFNVILVVHPIKFVFSCLSYSGWIGSGTNRFGFNLVRVILGSGLHQVNKSSGRFGFDSGHYSFGSVRFWVGLISDFGSKSVQLFLMSVRGWFRVVWFGSFGSGHFCQV